MDLYVLLLVLYILGLAGFLVVPVGPAAATARIATGGNIKADLKLRIANTGWKKMRGLMGEKSLPPDAGMLFSFRFIRRPSFWMKNTHIPLDIIFVGADHRITEIREHCEPLNKEQITPREACRHVIEVNAGFCREKGIRAGDGVRIRRP
jgi:uncharacterized membrane protein (UPF0127 family)